MFYNLKRSPEKVKAALAKSGDCIVAKQTCKVYFPKRFEDIGLAEMTGTVKFVGLYAIAIDGYYCVDIIPAMIPSEPVETEVVSIDGVDYYELTYEKGSMVVSNRKLVQNKLMMYTIDSEIFQKGRVPAYYTYEDAAKIFDQSAKFGGMKLGASRSVMAMISMTIARDPKDGITPYRLGITDKKDLVTRPPTYVALRNIGVTADNTTSKLLGSYFDKGLTSALINPADRNEGIEDHLRD